MVTWQTLLMHFAVTFLIGFLRYLFFAGVLYSIFYVWKKRELLKFKIQQKFPKNKDVIREIKYSILSLLVFETVGIGVFLLHKAGYTKIYTDFNLHSTGYFIFSVIAFILIHDTYFYWTHRAMHWKKIYPYVHKIHHQSTNPTPWAAFAFHPLEALVEVGVLPLVIFIMPVHHFAILAWVLYMSGMNVMGHLGYELFPGGFTTGIVSKWHNTSTHHNMHHKFVTCNYGLYFNIWDRIMRTNHLHYSQYFENVKAETANWPKQEDIGNMEPVSA